MVFLGTMKDGLGILPLRKRNDCASAHTAATCPRALTALFLVFVASGVWAQQLDVQELRTTADRSFHFQNYEGREPVIESIEQIAGIGGVLSRSLQADRGRGDYFGKYSVIRAYQPFGTTLLSADIIIFSNRAKIDSIRNVQRLVAGYLAAAFGYDSRQAYDLAVLVTNYNAAYRGDINGLSQKYTPFVMSYLSAENAGISASYAEWPGKTRLVVPLAHGAGAKAGPAASTQATPPPRNAMGALPESERRSTHSETVREPNAPAGPLPSVAGPTQGVGRESSTSAGPSAQRGGEALTGSAAQRGAAEAGPSGGAVGQSAVRPGVAAPVGPGRQSPLSNALHRINWLWLLALAALLLLALLAWVIVRTMIRTVFQPSYDQELRRSVQTGHPLIEMIVIPQNRRIGHRNIHYLRPGAKASVGGGRSRFLIFFVPVPRRMALLKYDGSRYTFMPLAKELFPGVESDVLDCLGKSIPARSLKGYDFAIIFHKFVPPLEEINRLMRSILPGSPGGTTPSA